MTMTTEDPTALVSLVIIHKMTHCIDILSLECARYQMEWLVLSVKKLQNHPFNFFCRRRWWELKAWFMETQKLYHRIKFNKKNERSNGLTSFFIVFTVTFIICMRSRFTPDVFFYEGFYARAGPCGCCCIPVVVSRAANKPSSTASHWLTTL